VVAISGLTALQALHTCASLLFQSDVHPKFVQELLGHASVAVTLDTYSHMLRAMGDQTARAMQDARSPRKSSVGLRFRNAAFSRASFRRA
jgi:integrase